jgi:hypothetical protein
LFRKGGYKPFLLQHLEDLGEGDLRVSVQRDEVFHEVNPVKLCSPSKQGWTMGHEDAVFILLDRDLQLIFFIWVSLSGKVRPNLFPFYSYHETFGKGLMKPRGVISTQ